MKVTAAALREPTGSLQIEGLELTFVGTPGMAGVGSPEMTFGYTSPITGRR